MELAKARWALVSLPRPRRPRGTDAPGRAWGVVALAVAVAGVLVQVLVLVQVQVQVQVLLLPPANGPAWAVLGLGPGDLATEAGCRRRQVALVAAPATATTTACSTPPRSASWCTPAGRNPRRRRQQLLLVHQPPPWEAEPELELALWVEPWPRPGKAAFHPPRRAVPFPVRQRAPPSAGGASSAPHGPPEAWAAWA